MSGIIAYGIYIPRYRLSRKTISTAISWFSSGFSSGEKAVANYDEDAVTMAVAAGMNCLRGFDRAKVGGVFFASTTAPYRENESAALIATALDLPSSVRTADFGNSLKAGTAALLAACEAVKAGAENILVCVADSRLGKPGSSQESISGDGAAAFLIGNNGVIASLEGEHSVSYSFSDHWRTAQDKFDRSLEDRLIRDEGYNKFIGESISGLTKKAGLAPKDFARLAYPGIYPRDHGGIGKKLGFQPGQVQDPLVTTIGDSGAASPLIMLAAELDEARANDNLIVASYGNGSQALWFKATDAIKTNAELKKYLASRADLTNYEKYLTFRGILPVEVGSRGEVGPTSMALVWRQRGEILGMVGSRCKRCGTPQYPVQRICVNPECVAVDQMEPYRFADKRGNLFSFTEDRLAFSLNPPQIYGVVDFEGGGRYTFDITDCEPGTLKLGMPMEPTFRRKYLDEVRGINGYAWKMTPVRG